MPFNDCTFSNIVNEAQRPFYDSLSTGAGDKKFHMATAVKCWAGFKIRLMYLFIYLFSVDGKHSHNRLCDMNTRQKRQENEQKKKKFILYCTKFKELDLASAHVAVSLNLTGIH